MGAAYLLGLLFGDGLGVLPGVVGLPGFAGDGPSRVGEPLGLDDGDPAGRSHPAMPAMLMQARATKSFDRSVGIFYSLIGVGRAPRTHRWRIAFSKRRADCRIVLRRSGSPIVLQHELNRLVLRSDVAEAWRFY